MSWTKTQQWDPSLLEVSAGPQDMNWRLWQTFCDPGEPHPLTDLLGSSFVESSEWAEQIPSRDHQSENQMNSFLAADEIPSHGLRSESLGSATHHGAEWREKFQSDWKRKSHGYLLHWFIQKKMFSGTE